MHRKIPLFCHLGLLIWLAIFLLILIQVDAITNLFAQICIIGVPLLLLALGLFSCWNTKALTPIKWWYTFGSSVTLVGILSFMIPTAPTTINITGALLVLCGLGTGLLGSIYILIRLGERKQINKEIKSLNQN